MRSILRPKFYPANHPLISKMVTLKLLALTPEIRTMYENHGAYHQGDSGLDLFVVEDKTIKAGETEFIKLGIKVAGYCRTKSVSWLLMPRSSISKTPLRLANSVGLVDAGYRGEIIAAVDNIKTTDYTIKKGDRFFQAVAFNGEEISFELVDELDETIRGEGGFGSTNAPKTGSVRKIEAEEPEAKKSKNIDENIPSNIAAA